MNKIIFSSILCFLLLGCGNFNGSSANGPLEKWVTFDGKTVPLGEMGDKQSTVYFYREKGSFSGPAVNVFVDGDYLASILDGGYRAAIVCSAGERILPSFTTNERFADRDSGIDYNFITGETSYVKIALDENNLPIFERVDPAVGQEAISQLAQETQTLPRTKPNRLCNRAVLEKITMEAHSLFKFDKWTYANMLPEGREEIKRIGEKIKEYGIKVDEVKVVGYTDPMGTKKYNLALSKRRAKTVKSALIKAGVDTEINAQGLGEKHLKVRGCLKKHRRNRKARIACDQPNRRVEIILYGSRQSTASEAKSEVQSVAPPIETQAAEPPTEVQTIEAKTLGDQAVEVQK